MKDKKEDFIENIRERLAETSPDTVACPACGRQVLHLVNHHWTRKGQFHLANICSPCNRTLGLLFGNTYPCWRVQVRTLRQYLVDQELVPSVPTTHVSEYRPETTEEKAYFNKILNSKTKKDSRKSHRLAARERVLKHGLPRSPATLPPRNRRIVEMRQNGQTLESIGQKEHLTKERVRQIVDKYMPTEKPPRILLTKKEERVGRELYRKLNGSKT